MTSHANQNEFVLGDILSFDQRDGHPISRVVGIDRYSFDAMDGQDRSWNSFTLEALEPEAQTRTYARWYVVDLPDLGLSFVQSVKPEALPIEMAIEPKLTGAALVQSEGDAEMGTGRSDIWTYWDQSVNPPAMYAKEIFADGNELYFKTSSLKGPVVVQP